MEPINWHTFFFMLFALSTCAFAVGVVLANNIVRMAAYLVVSLGSVAGLHFLAGADFVGAMQLMVYVGGTMVLLVFGVMLTAQSQFISMKIDGSNWAMAALAGGSLLVLLLYAATSVDDWRSPRVAEAGKAVEAAPTATPIGMAMLGARVDQLDQPNDVLRNGMSGYLLAFEIVSVHLAVVLIGAAFLARSRRRKQPTIGPPPEE